MMPYMNIKKMTRKLFATFYRTYEKRFPIDFGSSYQKKLIIELAAFYRYCEDNCLPTDHILEQGLNLWEQIKNRSPVQLNVGDRILHYYDGALHEGEVSSVEGDLVDVCTGSSILPIYLDQIYEKL